MESLKEAFDKFKAETPRAVVDAEYFLLENKANRITLDSLKGITPEEHHALSDAVRYPASIIISGITSPDQEHLIGKLFLLVELSAVIGYYMGKTGEKFDGL